MSKSSTVYYQRESYEMDVRRYESTPPEFHDNEAAKRIESLFRSKTRRDQLAARILRDLISREAVLEDSSLDSLVVAADQVIFNGALGRRVEWRWSENNESQYENGLLGTTAFKEGDGSRETTIVLSTPLLRDRRQYSRDLLLSTFFHELIHSYLFIQCGLDHATDGGHTIGFHRIANIINEWVLQVSGHRRLHLCKMRANLNNFPTIDTLQHNTPPDIPLFQTGNSGATSPPYVLLSGEYVGLGG
jgi:hypothetical protein